MSRRSEAGTTTRTYPSGVATTSVFATSAGSTPSASASASADSVCRCGSSSNSTPCASSAVVTFLLATVHLLFVCLIFAAYRAPDKSAGVRWGPPTGQNARVARRRGLRREDMVSALQRSSRSTMAKRGKVHDYYHRLHRADSTQRSEEHTSELQSHHDLVCRLLLEKKK